MIDSSRSPYHIHYSLNYNYVFRKLGISQIQPPHPSSMLGKYTAKKSNLFLRDVAVRCFVVVVVVVLCCFFPPTVCMLISEWNKVWKNEGNRSPARDRRPYIFSRRIKQEQKKAVWSSSRPCQEKDPNTFWAFWGYAWVWVSLVSNCTLRVKVYPNLRPGSDAVLFLSRT